MGWMEPVEIAVPALFLVLVVLVLLLFIRRRMFSSRGGTFDCAIKAPKPTDRGRTQPGWRLGFARYGATSLEWFAAFSLNPRPTRRIPRRAAMTTGTRMPTPDEARGLFAHQQIMLVDVRGADGTVEHLELAMDPATLMALMSWLEASPPQSDSDFR